MVTIKNLRRGRLKFDLSNGKVLSLNSYQSVDIPDNLVTDTMKNAVAINAIAIKEGKENVSATKSNKNVSDNSAKSKDKADSTNGGEK